MKPCLELTVEKLVPGGLGLARHEGEVILLPEALPGETVMVELGERRKGVRRGRVVSVAKPSVWRTRPDCPWAARCGGCDFQHVRPEAALELKSQAALGDLAEKAKVTLELVESPLWERYRGRATLHLGLGGQGRLSVGFMPPRAEEGGVEKARDEPTLRSVVEFDDCRLLAPELSGLIAPLRQWAGALAPDTPPVDLSLMLGAVGSGLTIFFSPPPFGPAGRKGGSRPKGPSPGQTASFRAALDRLPPALADHQSTLGLEDPLRSAPIAVFARTRPGGPPVKISPGGPDRLTAAHWPQWNLTLSAAPGGFTQVNPAVNRLMVEKILSLADLTPSPGRPREALDLYSGLGNIALPLMKAGFAVTAVEQAPESAAAARENAKGLAGFTFINDLSERAAAELAHRGRAFDLIVMDPPRAGAPRLAPTVAALNPRMIIYLACHPAVLTRDLPALASLGFRLRNLIALDMFPRTSHLEALAVLTPN